jgi:signal transduction histidine kinase
MADLLSLEHRILEKGKMEYRPYGIDPAGRKIRDVSGITIRATVEYLEEVVEQKEGAGKGVQAVLELCALLNERIPDPTYHVTPELLKNIRTSCSYEFTCYMGELCEQLSGDRNFSFHIGQYKLLGKLTQTIARPFSIAQIYRMFPRFGDVFVKDSLILSARDITTCSAILGMQFTDAVLEQFGPYRKACARLACNTTKAALAAVPWHIHHGEAATITDLRCVAMGDNCCEWEFRWTPQSPPSWVPSIAGALMSGFTFAALQHWHTEMQVLEALVISVISGMCCWLAFNRHALHQKDLARQNMMQEQSRAIEGQYNDLREVHLEQQRIAGELKRKVTQLMTLHRASLICNSITDRELLIKQALETIVKDLHYERVRIAFFNEHNQEYTGIRILGGPAEIARLASSIQTTITDPETIEGTVLLKGQPVLINDMADIMDRLHPLNQRIVRQLGTRSLVSVPMKVEDRILGSISVDRSQPHMLTQEDVEVLSTFGNHFAIALNNLAAYGEIETLNAELEEKVRVRTAQLESANARLKELDQLKSTFVSVVSHEVRTPMTSIRMQVENMLDGLIGSLNDEQSHSLSRILFSVDRLTRLSGDLLDLSKIESGTVELRREPLQLKSVVDEIVDAFRYLFAEKSVGLEVAHADETVAIVADRDKLVQVFINLLGNALKFTGNGGTIQILTEVQPDGFVSIRVTDSGCGIAPDELPRVFEKFYRGAGVPSGARGAGLGLAIVKHLVELHGGTVGVESTVGTGTSFFFTVPISHAQILTPTQ